MNPAITAIQLGDTTGPVDHPYREGIQLMSRRFASKIALVTGGGTGIGAATARRLADEGATVVITGRRLDKLQEVAGHQSEGTIAARQLDVADPSAVATVVDGIVNEFGALDVVVNNAGIGPSGTVEQTTETDWAV